MSGRTPEPVLDLVGAFSALPISGFRRAALDLHMMAGECVFVDTQHTSAATDLADICCGLLPLQSGLVRFLGYDWAHASDEQRAALRGQIGRLHGSNSWIRTLGTDTNILLAQLHHTRRSELELREAAAQWACRFGLPGLPTSPPDALSQADLVRADCVRALVGRPGLLIIEEAVLEQTAEVSLPLLNALAYIQNQNVASLWLGSGDSLLNEHAFPVAARLRLTNLGLVPMRDQL